MLRHVRFTVREMGLFMVLVAVALSWWLDRWQDNSAVRYATNVAHDRWIRGFESELQRVADETGRPIRISSPGVSLSFEPSSRRE